MSWLWTGCCLGIFRRTGSNGPMVTRKSGDAWLATGRSALLSVPSALVPETSNVLLNPGHLDAPRVVIVQEGEYAIDPRLVE
jgi:RES domain-containing protein